MPSLPSSLVTEVAEPTSAAAEHFLPLTSEPRTMYSSRNEESRGDYHSTDLRNTLFGAYNPDSAELSHVGAMFDSDGRGPYPRWSHTPPLERWELASSPSLTREEGLVMSSMPNEADDLETEGTEPAHQNPEARHSSNPLIDRRNI